MPALNLVYMGLLFSTLIIQASLFKKFSGSLLKNLLLYSFTGGVFLGMIRLLFWATEENVMHIGSATLMIGWHLMFYVTMTIFLVASRTLLKMSKLKEENRRSNPVPTILSMSGLMLLIFPFTAWINEWTMAIYRDSFFDRAGVVHFIAFIFAGFLTYDLGEIKKKFADGIGIISSPLQYMLAILSYIHLQELLIESWKVVKLPGEMGELIESVLWVPVFVLFLYAFISLKRITQESANAIR